MLMGLGVENIAAYTRLLKEPLLRLADAGRFDITSPTDPDQESAIVCIAPRDLIGAFQRLNEANVVCSMREGAIRLSPHCYNTVEEMERVAGILASCR
jgi:selenocysteine lyase/cysteine desulfurase